MTIDYRDDHAVLSEVVGVEEAEALLQWLQAHARAHVDLAGCTHLHPANLQVLMAAQSRVSAWPRDTALATWLASALPAHET
jgi:hypothetical protein